MTKCSFGCTNGRIFLEALGRKVDCPECRNIEVVLEKPSEDGKSIFDKLRIPSAYKNFGVAGQELFNIQGLGAFSQNSINEVGNFFERVNKDIYSGAVSNISAYIYTSNIVDTKRFVYGAQKLAIEKGLKVTPLISANNLYGLQRVGDFALTSLKELSVKEGELKDVHPELIHAVEGYRFVQHTDLTYFDFIHSDLCFIDATANTTEKGWTGLADLLGERAKQGLPTYVLGYWSTRGAGVGGSRGLRYLIAPEYGSVRLDLLVPFELKSKNVDNNEDTQVQRVVNYGTAKSSVTAGLSINNLMG